jgi:hypothetical protein
MEVNNKPPAGVGVRLAHAQDSSSAIQDLASPEKEEVITYLHSVGHLDTVELVILAFPVMEGAAINQTVMKSPV